MCVSLTWKTGDEPDASFVIIASYVHEEEEMSEQETSSGQFYHSGRIPRLNKTLRNKIHNMYVEKIFNLRISEE